MKIILASVLLLSVWTSVQGHPYTPHQYKDTVPLSSFIGVTKNIELYHTKTGANAKYFNDPFWPLQWYVQDYRTKDGPVMDHDVVDVYETYKVNGKGVDVAVLGDGVQHGHPDLDAGGGEDNFLEELSYDYCKGVTGSNTAESSNATKAAGVIAMKEDNKICGAGIAHEAKIIGVTVSCNGVDGVTADRNSESQGLVHQLDKVEIYSNTWGPKDDGKSMEEIGHAVEAALYKGVTEGREGKGAIYLFDAGDGKALGDNCAADDIINNLTTIAIAGATQRGRVAWYSESCPGIMATAYSGGDDVDGDGKIDGVVSIDSGDGCTSAFTGTTAATPIAAGIIALALEKNPALTYRDVMHLIAYTTEVAPLADNCDDTWKKNAANFFVSNDFGFGLLNGENIVKMAGGFKTVPAKKTCSITVKLETPGVLSVGQDVMIPIDYAPCQNSPDDVDYLEQIEVVSSVEFPDRGDIEVDIESPLGTYTDLLDPRRLDDSKDGLKNWSIKSVHTWGENPEGKWRVIIKATDLDRNNAESTGKVTEVTLRLHGTKEKPEHYKTKRAYQTFRLPNGETSED